MSVGLQKRPKRLRRIGWCGFTITDEDKGFPNACQVEVETFIPKLDDANPGDLQKKSTHTLKLNE